MTLAEAQKLILDLVWVCFFIGIGGILSGYICYLEGKKRMLRRVTESLLTYEHVGARLHELATEFRNEYESEIDLQKTIPDSDADLENAVSDKLRAIKWRVKNKKNAFWDAVQLVRVAKDVACVGLPTPKKSHKECLSGPEWYRSEGTFGT